MWLFTKYGFFSSVCAREGDGAYHRPVDRTELWFAPDSAIIWNRCARTGIASRVTMVSVASRLAKKQFERIQID